MQNPVTVSENTFNAVVIKLGLTESSNIHCQDLLDDYLDENGAVQGQHEVIGGFDVYQLTPEALSATMKAVA